MGELLFADDSAPVAHSAEEMQKIVNAFSDASKKFGLKINTKKAEVLYQPNFTRNREEVTMIDGYILNSVLEYTYFGSTPTKRRQEAASTPSRRRHSRPRSLTTTSSQGKVIMCFNTRDLFCFNCYSFSACNYFYIVECSWFFHVSYK